MTNYAATNICRLVMVPMTAVFTGLAFVMTAIAVALPSWLYVEIGDLGQWHDHGLWLDCIRGYSSQPTLCTYKFDNPAMSPDRPDPYNAQAGLRGNDAIQHTFQDWHKATLVLLLIAEVCGAAAFCFVLCALCARISSIVADVFNLVAVCTSFTAMFIFFIVSHRMDVRMITAVINAYEQYKGTAFYLGCVGVLFYAVAFIVGILSTILVFLHNRNNQLRRSGRHTNRSSLLLNGGEGLDYSIHGNHYSGGAGGGGTTRHGTGGGVGGGGGYLRNVVSNSPPLTAHLPHHHHQQQHGGKGSGGGGGGVPTGGQLTPISMISGANPTLV